MKFTEAWIEVINQNNLLKAALAVSTVCTFVLCVTVVQLALRDPLVIERECYSRTVAPATTKQTAAEIEGFVRFALPRRFDTEAVDSRVLLGEEEFAYRLKEQDDLARKGMKQKVFPSEVKVTEKGVEVQADRILSVGAIRSNVPFALNVQVTATSRTPANPYGLVIQRVSQTNKEEGKQ